MKQIFPIFAFFLHFCMSSCNHLDSLPEDTPLYSNWEGDTSHFQESDEGDMLLSSLIASGEASVYTSVDPPIEMDYKFKLFTELNPSSRNYARVYLWCKTPDTGNPGKAFFIRLGYTKDNVCLCYQEENKTPRILIEGREKILDSEWSEVSVHVTVDKGGVFHLFTRTGQEETYTEEGEYTYKDSLPATSGYFMLNCKFTSKGREAFSFEDILVKPLEIKGEQLDEEKEKPEEKLPELVDTKIISTTSFLFIFDQPINNSQAIFTLAGEKAIDMELSFDKKQITVYFAKEMQEGKEYQLIWKGITAVKGKVEAKGILNFIYKQEASFPDDVIKPQSFDIVINEILFDPFSGGSEYIELYNRSSNTVNISGLSVAIRKQDGSLSTKYSLSSVDKRLMPGEYVVLTKKKEEVIPFYTLLSEETICEIDKLPVLSNNSATLVLFDSETEEAIDEVTYSSKWHTPLIKETKGVSLERISPDAASQDKSNWSSASADAGYGTPGYKNSQSSASPEGNAGDIGIGTPIKEKESDTYQVTYILDESGYMYKSAVYDATGNRVISIATNETSGLTGIIRWNSKRDNGKYLRPGIYIFYVEFYHTNGKIRKFKKAFVVMK